MGLKKYAVEQVSIIELCDANDQPMIGNDEKRITVEVYGPGSKQYARAQSDQQNRMFDKLKRKGKTEQSAEDKAREQAEFLSACTKSASGNLGEDYPGLTGRDLYMAVYSDREIGFVAEQVGKYLGDWANFSKASTENSASTSGNTPG